MTIQPLWENFVFIVFKLLVNSKTPRAPENHLKGHWLPPFLFHSLLTCFRVAACPWNDNSSIVRKFCLHSQLLVNSKTPRAPKNHLKGHWLPPFLFHSLLTWLRVATCQWNDNPSIVRKFCLHSQLLVNSKTPRAPKKHLKEPLVATLSLPQPSYMVESCNMSLKWQSIHCEKILSS